MTGDVHRSAAEGYATGADAYVAGRPTYHPTVVTAVADSVRGGRVLDLGAGTGIATAALVDQRLDVVAVEPVDAMRAELARRLPTVEVLAGGAEAIPLDDGAIDAVVVAQAFHWFDHERCLDELDRVLAPGGTLVTLWNVRDESVPWMAEWTRICDAHAVDTPRYRTMRWRDAIEADPRFGLSDEVSTPNPYPSSPEGAVQRALSTSFIAALDDDRRADVADRIRALVTPLGDRFEFPYRSEAQIWRRVG
ncbi:MAG: class I SAM-dependent methyltransferase [Actinomycetota bacterium]